MTFAPTGNSMLALSPELNVLALVADILWLVVFAWLTSILLTLYGLSRRQPLLPANDLAMTASDVPLVSVLVPARNEQHRVLPECIRSLLAQDYGCFEVIAVNDRSTDATGEILEKVAESDGRLCVFAGEEPPAGWFCSPKASEMDHKCACKRMDSDQMCEGTPQEDRECKVWCHKDHCRCPVMCTAESKN